MTNSVEMQTEIDMNNKTKEINEKLKTENEIRKHIYHINYFLMNIIHELLQRMKQHDISKLTSPELEIFTEYTPKLAASTYGSKEYQQFLKKMGVALEHHYEHNRHHPEHFENGVNDMSLVDIIEMLCDWKAATLRHDDGDINKSIEINRERFNMSEQLIRILKNTIIENDIDNPRGIHLVCEDEDIIL